MIIGTAGHIDHGKSALVRRLTGVDPDRLKEEKQRGITIDLGFAYMPAGDGEVVGFVDVPGHDRFVRNMLAGATGIDFVLLVVAADDGIMPQTREHLAIVNLLGITRGLVALTKADLVPPGRLSEVTQDLRTILRSTGLSEAKILSISAVTGEGIEELRGELIIAARAFKTRKVQGRFRLAVDRCFTLSGAGTIVTGSVISGAVSVGDSVAISPSGLRARVRSIHAQNRPAEHGYAGERCALNLVGDGISKQAIARGDVVADPVLHAPASRIDAMLQLLESETRPLAHWTPVHLHHAAVEVAARVALLEEAPISPGATGRVQLVLDRAIAAAAGDRFILRDTSASRTIGGGRFADLRAPHRHRRAQVRLAQLEALAIEDPGEALAALLGRWPFFVEAEAFARDRALSEEQMREALRDVAHDKVGAAAETILLSPAVCKQLSESAHAAVDSFHHAHPQARGLSAAQLAAALEPRLPARVSNAVVGQLVKSGALILEGGAMRAIGRRSELDASDESLGARIVPLLSGESRFRPPRVNEIAGLLKQQDDDVRRVLRVLAKQREVVEVASDHFFLRKTVDEMTVIIADIALAQPNGEVSVGRFRDRVNNGRKMAIQILEYFDRQGFTARRGDLRRVNARRLEQFVGASDSAPRGPN